MTTVNHNGWTQSDDGKWHHDLKPQAPHLSVVPPSEPIPFDFNRDAAPLRHNDGLKVRMLPDGADEWIDLDGVVDNVALRSGLDDTPTFTIRGFIVRPERHWVQGPNWGSWVEGEPEADPFAPLVAAAAATDPDDYWTGSAAQTAAQVDTDWDDCLTPTQVREAAKTWQPVDAWPIRNGSHAVITYDSGRRYLARLVDGRWVTSWDAMGRPFASLATAHITNVAVITSPDTAAYLEKNGIAR